MPRVKRPKEQPEPAPTPQPDKPATRRLYVVSQVIKWKQIQLGSMDLTMPFECGDGFFPVFWSLEALQKAHPGLPYLTFETELVNAT